MRNPTLRTSSRGLTATLIAALFAAGGCGRSAEAGAATLAPTGSESAGRPALAVDVGGGVTMEFVLVPAGRLVAAQDDAVPGGEPAKSVEIAKPFYLARHEVTQEQWQAVMGTNPSEFKGPKNPVENVSWNDCRDFLAKLNARTSGPGFFLPSESQWEYACRAGSTTRWCCGDDASALRDYAWDSSNANGKTHPVGQKKPNAWGLYDMHGNVWEWCDDAFAAGGGDGPNVGPAASNAVGADRAFRGGSWYFTSYGARSAFRASGDPAALRRSTLGFRPARAVER